MFKVPGLFRAQQSRPKILAWEILGRTSSRVEPALERFGSWGPERSYRSGSCGPPGPRAIANCYRPRFWPRLLASSASATSVVVRVSRVTYREGPAKPIRCRLQTVETIHVQGPALSHRRLTMLPASVASRPSRSRAPRSTIDSGREGKDRAAPCSPGPPFSCLVLRPRQMVQPGGVASGLEHSLMAVACVKKVCNF